MGRAIGPQPQWVSDCCHIPWVEVGRRPDAGCDRGKLEASHRDRRCLAGRDRRVSGPEKLLVLNIGAVGAAGLLPQPPWLALGLKVTTHRL